MQRSQNAGFTLIELLVVISIIGVLAGLLLTNFVGVRERAADARMKSDLDQLKKALRLYYNDNQEYPSSIPSTGTFSDNGTVYMKDVPMGVEYEASSDGEGFVVIADLANESDESIAASQARCDTSGYTVSVDPDTSYVVCED